ncbi:uncharacterized protein VTP21DRAFT_3217 [Calcarisporiella thermophila]|uniref:uncharacterized protein n=1 Tax=Calcarisporiella thermophila TaxID=911321 RepID=UPI0037429687
MRISSVLAILSLALACSAAPSLDKRIIGGTDVQPDELPFIAEIRNRRSPCTAFVIAPRVIMTAAHCLGDRSHSGVIYGSNLKGEGHSADDVKFVPHPAYDSKKNLNDIGLIFVEQPMNTTVAKIGMKYPKAGSTIMAAGFGDTDNQGGDSPNLKKVALKVATAAECKVNKPNFDSKTQFCTSDKPVGHSVCNGDSGGPLYTGSGKSLRVVGLVSHGTKARACGEEGNPQYFTFIKPYLKWVRSEIRKFESEQSAQQKSAAPEESIQVADDTDDDSSDA